MGSVNAGLTGSLLLALAACASPNPKLYTLAATTSVAPVSSSAIIELRRVSIPGYADRPEIVRQAAAYRVDLAGNARWSEPFGDMVQRVLTEDLNRRLVGAVVYSDQGPISATPTRVVEVDIGRIAANDAGQVVLDAHYAVRDQGAAGVTATRSVHVTVPIATSATADYAAALSTALGQLADAIATQI